MAFGAFAMPGNPGEPAIMSKGSGNPAEGRGPLGWGERKALEMQAANRATEGMTPGEVEARNLRSITIDRAIKAPRFIRS
jgi:hypothetical protein